MLENAIIRPAEFRDCPQIAEIYNRYILETTITFETEAVGEEEILRRMKAITDAGMPYHVCEADGRIVGYSHVHPWKQSAAYCKTLETTVYLRPECKGAGLGRRLMEPLIDDCRRQGYSALIACITADNAESISFHLRLGFSQVSRFTRVGYKFGQWLDVVDLELLL